MAITIYYINKNWELISRLINMELLIEIHDAIYLRKVLDRVLKSFELEDKIQTYVLYFIIFYIFDFLKIINYSFFSLIISRFTTNKADNNLLLVKQFRIDYKYQYNIDFYNVEYVVYTFNNVVENIIN